MVNEQNQNNGGDGEDEVSEEEKKSEDEALADVKEEELKSKVAEDFDISADDEPELFKKLLEREQSHREKLSGAIKQKISWRDKAKKPTTPAKPAEKPKEGDDPDPEKKPLTLDELDSRLDERDAKRDLESLGLSEEIETKVKTLAKVEGISVREAAKHPYIVSSIEEAEKAERVKSATPRRQGRGSHASTNVDPSKPLNPGDFALDTKKGRKAWADAKAAKREHEAQQ